MTQAVYILGGAGVGKSTFTADLMDRLKREAIGGGWKVGPLTDLHAKPNRKVTVTLRAHPLTLELVGGLLHGMYLGKLRDEFPGTDGLDRATSPTAAEWLEIGDVTGQLPDFIVGEGATLATDRFLGALEAYTDLLVLHLVCDPMIADLRVANRGHELSPQFVDGTATRSENRIKNLKTARVVRVDTSAEGYDGPWAEALDTAVEHILY